ncbi:MAG: hypothetical protein WCL18_04805 [bacterium]
MCCILVGMSIANVQAQCFFASGQEVFDFGHALGWVFVFNFFVAGPLMLLIHKKTIHIVFIVFVLFALWVGKQIIDGYRLGFGEEMMLFVACILPGALIYGYSLFVPVKHHRQSSRKASKKVSIPSTIVPF